ncbi:MAG: type II secretion system secretin GspD [Allosphingosinicella sp.]|uniref:type II secretion system secretin GspD n=1 Tax=Allosphingosinicella sp. TaxID=2823234 RepID=UPI0039465EB3
MKRILIALMLAGAPIAFATPAHAQYVLNLRDADIRAFIQDAARVTGRTFIIDPQVQGRVSVVTERPLSRSEYFELFLSTLRANGYVAVPAAGGALRIQPAAGAASSAPVGGSARRSASGFVTEIFRVRNIEPASAVETLRPLVSANGSITASRSSIVVSDFADNVRRVRQVLAQIDVGVDRSSTRVIGVENIGPRELAAALSALAPEGVSVVPIDSANSIALRGDAQTLARLAGVAAELDQRAARGTDVRVVFLEHADAAQLLPVLQTLLGQTPTYSQPLQNSRFANSGTGTDTAGRMGGGTLQANTRVQTAPQQQAQGAAPSTSQAELPPAYRNAVVTRFEGANAIVISATQDVQRMLSEVVRQLDVRREQVLVEAIIVEISDQAAQQIGVRLFLAGLNGSAIPFGITNYSGLQPNLGTIASAAAATQLGIGQRTDTDGDGDIDDDDAPGVSDELIRNAANALSGITGGVAGLGIRAGDALFGSIINAVRSDNRSNILSTPSIMTLDNQEARILVGQEIPITTGEALSPNFDNAFRTVQRQNVGITLQVRPQINAGGSIKMDLRVEVSSIAGPVSSSFQDLILNKREIENTITVDEGEIVGIGGLLDDNERRTIERIPLLGDIPIIGNLFRSRGRARAKTNLMIFIRPTILRSAEDARAIAARRYDYVRDQQLAINPTREPTIDELVRDYLGTVAPTAPPELAPTDTVVDPRLLPNVGGPETSAPVAQPAPAQGEVPMPTDAPRRRERRR